VNNVHSRLFAVLFSLYKIDKLLTRGGVPLRRKEWESINGHSGGVVWFSGLPGSGKSTLALAVEAELFKRGARCIILDGDQLRQGLCRDLGFSDDDRNENLRRASVVASMFVEAGFIVLVPMISPSEIGRAIVRKSFRTEDFVELYVKCSIAECEYRDPKGMYRMARQGEIPSFTGISAPYEPPENPDIIVDTERYVLPLCVDILVGYLRNQFIRSIERENVQ
jgi:adenylylsulfate kinase